MKVIGTVTKYVGREHPALRGHDVFIVAVVKGALAQGGKPELVNSDESIEASGGVTALDRVYITAFAEGQEVMVSRYARATDLECFRDLLRTRGIA